MFINANPFRYRYVLDFKKVDLFTNRTFNPKLENSQIVNGEEAINLNLLGGSNDNTVNIKNILTEMNDSIVDVKGSVHFYLEKLAFSNKVNHEELVLRREVYKETLIKYFSYLNSLSIHINSITEQSEKEILLTEQQRQIKELNTLNTKISKLFTAQFTYYTLPIDVLGDNIDYLEFKLQVYDGNNETPTNYTYKVWIKGGFKIDISGGIFGTSLFDSEYFTTDETITNNDGTISTTGNKYIHDKDLGKYDFGFGTTVNINFRGASSVTPTINLGAIFTENQKFQLLFGGGLILGKKQRIIFHTGISMGRVNVLRKTYEDSGNTAYDLGSEGTIPTDEKFKFGHYFGFTYNFSKPKGKTKEE